MIVSAIAAATPVLKELPHPDLTVYVPSIARLDGLLAFAERAGRHTRLLRPELWSSEFHPLVRVDLSRRESVEGAGIKFDAPLSVSLGAGYQLTCVALADPNLFQKRADEGLAARGDVIHLAQPTRLGGAVSDGVWMAGYWIRGRESCALSGESDVRALLKSSLQPFQPDADWRRLLQHRGAISVSGSHFSASFRASASSLVAEGEFIPKVPVPIARAGPFKSLETKLPSVAQLQASVELRSIASLLTIFGQEFRTICPTCPASWVDKLGEVLVAHATGAVLLNVGRLDFSAGLRDPSDRYLAVRHCLAFEIKNSAQVASSLASLPHSERLEAGKPSFSLVIPGGRVFYGARPGLLYIGNDPAVISQTLNSLQATQLKHPAELNVNLPGVAQSLETISLLDALMNKSTAPLAALSVELGPLLRASKDFRLVADNESRFTARWTLSTP